MNRLLRLLLALAVATAFASLGAPASHAQDTSAVAINTEDGSSLFEFAFDVRKTMKDVVESTNVAVAYASCEQCSTVAISFQVVLAGGDPSTVSPQNVAVALNEECSTCLTAAFAYQFVVAGDGPIRLTGRGQRRLARLRRELRELEDVDLTIEQLRARLDAAAAEIRDVLKTEIIRNPRDDDDDDEDDDDRDDERAGEEPAPPPTATPGAAATPEPTVTAAPTATPDVTPTPEPTETPAP